MELNISQTMRQLKRKRDSNKVDIKFEIVYDWHGQVVCFYEWEREKYAWGSEILGRECVCMCEWEREIKSAF